jgi:hypothetical protein
MGSSSSAHRLIQIKGMSPAIITAAESHNHFVAGNGMKRPEEKHSIMWTNVKGLIIAHSDFDRQMLRLLYEPSFIRI